MSRLYIQYAFLWFAVVSAFVPRPNAARAPVPVNDTLISENLMSETTTATSSSTTLKEGPLSEAPVNKALLSETTATSTTSSSNPLKEAPLSEAPVHKAPLSETTTATSTTSSSNPLKEGPLSEAPLSETATTTTSSPTPTISIDTSIITSTPFPSYTLPYCSVPATITTEYCRVSVGTVRLHYWPTGDLTVGESYPSTVVLSDYGVIMTSPSVYYVIDEMKATDYCGNLIGPIVTNFITSYDLDQVSTLPPFANSNDDTRIGGPTQLQLSDLKTDCPQTYSIPVNNHNLVGDEDYDPGCNPVIEYKIELKDAVAGGAWRTCGRYWGGKLGIFDPPSPVTPCGVDNCGDAGAASPTVAPPLPPPIALPTTALQATTPTPDAPPPPPAAPPPSAPALPVETAPPQTSTPAPEPPIPPPEARPVPQPTPEQSAPAQSTPEQPAPANPGPVDQDPNRPAETPPVEEDPIPTIPIPIATIPIVINSDVGGIPTIIPGSNVISAIPGQSHVVIGGQTVAQGGSAVTILGAGVVNIAPSGVVVSNPENGAVTTYALPPAPPPAPAPEHQSIGVVEGQTISGIAIGPSQAVAGGYTLSIGGAVATLVGNQVASLGTDGLRVEAQGGIVTTLAVPTKILPPPVSDEPQASPTGANVIVIPSDAVPVSPPSGEVLPAAAPSSGPPISIPTDAPTLNTIPESSTTEPADIGSIGPTATTTVTSTGLGGVIYNTFQGAGSRVTHSRFFGSILSLVFSVLYALNW